MRLEPPPGEQRHGRGTHRLLVPVRSIGARRVGPSCRDVRDTNLTYHPRPMSSFRHSTTRSALAASALSFIVWSALYLWAAQSHPWGDISEGHFADHVSHVNAARVFPAIGADVWRRPVDAMFPPANPRDIPSDPQLATLPRAFLVSGFPDDKPFVQGWSASPRMYPAGLMALVAPIAAAYHFTDLSFAASNRIAILWFLAIAHVGFFFLIHEALRTGETRRRVLFLVIVYGTAIYWTLEGFYDAAAVAPLFLCGALLAERRGVAALTAYCASAALHFRAFFLAPWALYAAYLAWNERPFRKRDWAALVTVGLLSIASLYPFALVAPWLSKLPARGGLDGAPGVIAVLVISGACAAAFAWARSWLDVAVVAWVTLMLLTMRATYGWYVIFLLPWLVAPAIGRAHERSLFVTDVRFVAIAGLSAVAFRFPLVPGWPLLPVLLT
jgi:hypothetical protein